VYGVGQKSLQRLPAENIRLKTEKMNGKIVPQRQNRLQTYWYLKLAEMLTAPGEIYPRKLSVYGVGQKRLQRLPPENIRLKTEKMTGKIVPQREHRLQTYWYLKLTEMLTAPGEIYPRYENHGVSFSTGKKPRTTG
jgi:hypothetical protein